MHVLEMKGHRLLLECGLFQGHRKESMLRNRILPFPFDVSMIDSAVLSHAHIDHAGNFPTLAKKGFGGNIFSTSATRDLSSIMLMDSAYIQKADAEYLNKHELYDPDFGPVDPIYDEGDVLKAMGQFISIDYHREFDVAHNVKCKFLEAGHVLGSSIVQLDVKTHSGKTRIAFTGDLGRRHMPLMREPEPPIQPNYLIIESTYGDRVHEPISTMKTQLARVVNETFGRRGKVIIPSFSLERTQLLVYTLNQLVMEKAIPEIPVYVDSPLSVRLTDIFKLHPDSLDEDVRKMISGGHDPFGATNLSYITEVSDSMALNEREEPMIIISASGMCEGGRIVHHLRNNMENPNNTILVIGYMAQHTLGRRIVERRRRVRILGVERDLNARVEVINSFSAHADKNELVEFVEACGKQLKGIFIVHGDEDQSLALGNHLKAKGFEGVVVPMPKQFIEID
ncbi:MAG TPA: MBL fold metallo-hydrolase [bacterium]|nr:MBL fold metallo-hydrolase [bacterium]